MTDNLTYNDTPYNDTWDDATKAAWVAYEVACEDADAEEVTSEAAISGAAISLGLFEEAEAAWVARKAGQPEVTRKGVGKRPAEPNHVKTYIRTIDGAKMGEIAPHQYVNEACLAILGRERTGAARQRQPRP